ncbi:glycosyltransferase family 4 protein, partial [Candidatus Sumerlaeota bacterium]|nr:glycosyltransferase family 4 protein [Candidatus Sumerlaeota bacterium]
RACQQRYHAAHYVFCAAWLVDGFRERYPQIPPGQVHVVLNGVDHNAFRPGPLPSVNRIPRIIFYAGWLPSKGIYELLSAIELLEQERRDFEVHFGGSAFSHYKRAESPEIDRRVRELAAKLKTVKLIGHVDHDALPELLREMDIGCVPSVYEDPFPLVPLEMMAAGLPVVAFAVGGLKESVVHGETGFLVENKNVRALARALETLIDNEQLRLEMGAKARKRVVQYFTWDRHVDQLLEIYEQIIKRNRDRKQ